MFKIELFENELKKTSKGREILELISQHSDEVNQMVNHNREVMITWKRNKGPSFLAHFLDSGFKPDSIVPKKMGGIRQASLIRRMAVALQDYGSKQLCAVIDKYLLLVHSYTESYDSLYQLFQELRKHE